MGQCLITRKGGMIESWKEFTGSLMSAKYSQTSVSSGTKTATSDALSSGVKIRTVQCTFKITNNDSYKQDYSWKIEGYTNGSWKALKNGTLSVNATSNGSTTETYTDASDDLYTQMRYSISMKHAGSISGEVTKWLQKK